MKNRAVLMQAERCYMNNLPSFEINPAQKKKNRCIEWNRILIEKSEMKLPFESLANSRAAYGVPSSQGWGITMFWIFLLKKTKRQNLSDGYYLQKAIAGFRRRRSWSTPPAHGKLRYLLTFTPSLVEAHVVAPRVLPPTSMSALKTKTNKEDGVGDDDTRPW